MPSMPLETVAIVIFVSVVWVIFVYFFAVVFPRLLALLERF